MRLGGSLRERVSKSYQYMHNIDREVLCVRVVCTTEFTPAEIKLKHVLIGQSITYDSRLKRDVSVLDTLAAIHFN